MYPLIEAATLLILTALFWINRNRRRYYIQRIGKYPCANLWSIARNIAFMICRKPVQLCGSVSRIKAGCILYSIHYGIWERMPDPLIRQGHKVGVIVNRYGKGVQNIFGRLLDHFLTSFRSYRGVRIFDRDDTLKITRFLKQGGILGVLVDGNRFTSKLSKMRRLSELCKVPIIPFAAYRRHGQGLIDIGRDIERLVKSRPQDYLWFYRSRTP